MDHEAASAIVQIDNNQIRVTEWRLPPGTATGHHVHGHDYVVVPICDGELKAVAADGESIQMSLRRGGSYFRNAGVAHDVINVGLEEMSFVEIELKDTLIR